jgi:hypothetical protein
MKKGYTKKRYRRKIPKVVRWYDRHRNEDKTFDKSKEEEKDMAKSVEQEIDQLSENMAKSTNDPRDLVIATIEELGPEGLKKAMPNLSNDQKVLLKSVLTDMKKSVEMDDVYDGDKKFVQLQNAGTEEENGSDDEDEKLVKPEAANFKHQGGSDAEGEAGWEGQVIKGRGPDKKPRKRRGSGAAQPDAAAAKPKAKAKITEAVKDAVFDAVQDADNAGEMPTKEEFEALAAKTKMDVPSVKKLFNKINKEFKNHQSDSLHDGMSKSIADELECDEDLVKGLFESREKMAIKTKAEAPSKDDMFWDLKRAIRDMKEMKELRYTIEDELPEAKEAFEAKYSACKAKAKKYLTKYNSMKKSQNEDVNMAKSIEEMIDETLEKGYGMKKMMDKKDVKDVAEKEAKEEVKDHKDKMHKMKKSLIALKDEIIKSYEDAGLAWNNDLIKAEMKKKMNKEEDQVEMGGQDKGGKADRADKNAPDDIKVGKDAEETADEAVNKVGKMKKSVSYEKDENSLIKANTLGRNHHFSINAYYDEAIRKSAAGEEVEGEDLKKSESDYDINDLIEKGMDTNADDYMTNHYLEQQKLGGEFRKSFSDEDMEKACGMKKKDAAKVMGEDMEKMEKDKMKKKKTVAMGVRG